MFQCRQPVKRSEDVGADRAGLAMPWPRMTHGAHATFPGGQLAPLKGVLPPSGQVISPSCRQDTAFATSGRLSHNRGILIYCR
jgi:hypothetical protein